jgi:streptomycin 6-kinase
MFGVCALVLPVVCADGTPAVLKLQALDEETAGEPVALRSWGGEGAVRLAIRRGDGHLDPVQTSIAWSLLARSGAEEAGCGHDSYCYGR